MNVYKYIPTLNILVDWWGGGVEPLKLSLYTDLKGRPKKKLFKKVITIIMRDIECRKVSNVEERP